MTQLSLFVFVHVVFATGIYCAAPAAGLLSKLGCRPRSFAKTMCRTRIASSLGSVQP